MLPFKKLPDSLTSATDLMEIIRILTKLESIDTWRRKAWMDFGVTEIIISVLILGSPRNSGLDICYVMPTYSSLEWALRCSRTPEGTTHIFLSGAGRGIPPYHHPCASPRRYRNSIGAAAPRDD
jgi:hypothetical protein